MDVRRENWPVFSANKRRTKIDPRPPYQRGLVWSLSNQQLLIDSILKGYDIPKIYLRRIDSPKYRWEIIDGQQRLRAIWDFLAGHYSLPRDADSVDGHDISRKFYDELHEDLSDQLDSYELSVVIVENADDEDVEDMFLRLQNGLPLSSAEKRNAIPGNMTKFIRNTSATNKLMKQIIPFPDRRYSHAEVVAQMMCIETAWWADSGKPPETKENVRRQCLIRSVVQCGQKAKESHVISFKSLSPEDPRTHKS